MAKCRTGQPARIPCANGCVAQISASGAASERDDRHRVSALVVAPGTEPAHVGGRREVLAERRLERSGAMAVDDEGLARALGVELVEEAIDVPQELIPPESAYVEAMARRAHLGRARPLRRLQPLPAGLAEAGSGSSLAAQRQEGGQRPSHLPRPGRPEAA